jgi:deoxycytidylate deaminase
MDYPKVFSLMYLIGKGSSDPAHCGAVVVDQKGRIIASGFAHYPEQFSGILEKQFELSAVEDVLMRSFHPRSGVALVLPTLPPVRVVPLIVEFGVEKIIIHEERHTYLKRSGIVRFKDIEESAWMLKRAGILTYVISEKDIWLPYNTVSKGEAVIHPVISWLMNRVSFFRRFKASVRSFYYAIRY